MAALEEIKGRGADPKLMRLVRASNSTVFRSGEGGWDPVTRFVRCMGPHLAIAGMGQNPRYVVDGGGGVVLSPSDTHNPLIL